MNEYKSKVYVYATPDGKITRCEGGYSASNIGNISEWSCIDEGIGDRYDHCQNNYFDGGLYTYDGIPPMEAGGGPGSSLRGEGGLALQGRNRSR